MSQQLRIGNTYEHTEYGTVIITLHDSDNEIWFRRVSGRDNAGVTGASERVHHEPYDDFLGKVSMRDYPDDEEWSELRGVVKDRDSYRCQGCGTSDAELHSHHIVPLGCGGTNHLRNLITLCSECHGRVHGGRA